MKKKLIVIAEDEVAYGKILKDTFEKEAYDVIVVSNGLQLLKVIRKKVPAIVLLDLIMPAKNGFEVLIEMKKDAKLKDIRVVALSNLGQDDDIQKAKKLGADGYIVKSNETLYNVVHRIEKLLA